MFRIDGSAAALALPVPAAAGPHPNAFFTEGVVGVTAATVVSADWLNAVQEELINLLVQASIAPDKTNQGQVYAAILAIIGANDANTVINGSCIHGQLTGGRAQQNLSTSFQYAGVDRWAGAATGGAVTGGTIQQEAQLFVGTSQHAFSFLGVTLTGAGVLTARYRIESRDVMKFKNITAVIAALKVYHDTGAPVNYTIQIAKANTQDNFTAVTVIGSSANIPVATITPTTIGFSVAPADCSNGIEIKISAACGAIANKNFRFTELDFRAGSVIKTFQQSRLAAVVQECQRYYQIDGQGWCGRIVNGSGSAIIGGTLKAPMRATPTGTYLSNPITIKCPVNTSFTFTTSVGGAIGSLSGDQQGVTIGAFGGFGAPTSGALAAITTNSPFGFDAEL